MVLSNKKFFEPAAHWGAARTPLPTGAQAVFPQFSSWNGCILSCHMGFRPIALRTGRNWICPFCINSLLNIVQLIQNIYGQTYNISKNRIFSYNFIMFL